MHATLGGNDLFILGQEWNPCCRGGSRLEGKECFSGKPLDTSSSFAAPEPEGRKTQRNQKKSHQGILGISHDCVGEQ